MMRARTRALLLLVAVLLVGAVAGSALTTLLITRRLTALFDGSPKDTMARLYGFELDRELHLSPQQRQEVERIVRDDHPALAKLMQTIEPQLTVLRHQRHARIRALLTPAQQGRFDQLAERFEARHRSEIDLDR